MCRTRDSPHGGVVGLHGHALRIKNSEEDDNDKEEEKQPQQRSKTMSEPLNWMKL